MICITPHYTVNQSGSTLLGSLLQKTAGGGFPITSQRKDTRRPTPTVLSLGVTRNVGSAGTSEANIYIYIYILQYTSTHCSLSLHEDSKEALPYQCNEKSQRLLLEIFYNL